jgi:hypothetical protein
VKSATSRLFSQRAALYQYLDRHLASQTRFFGAAVVVNRALAELHRRPWGRWCAGAAASGLLLHIGNRLEAVNLRAAARLAARTRPGFASLGDTSLDVAMVQWEQLQVERLLRQLCLSDTFAHRHALVRIDQLLRWATRSAQPRGGPSSCASASVCQALRAVGAQLGRAARFGFCEDRQRIGQAIIGQLRQGAARQ